MRVTVLTGGSTPERDVAFAGAAQVVVALRARGYDVQVVDTVIGLLDSEDEARYLVPSVGPEPPDDATLAALRASELGPAIVNLPAVRECDLVFVLLHGRQGEGGHIQALLELAGIPFTGSGMLGSALAMDKDAAKRLFRVAGVPTPDWTMWPASLNDVKQLGYPLVVKPVKVGSSVGLTIVHKLEELDDAVMVAQRFDDEVMLERFVPGRELTVGVLGDRALAVGEIIPSHEIFDYECKYTPGLAQEIFPAEISRDLAARLQGCSMAVHTALKLSDFSRVDFKLANDGTPWCIEVNTLPGLTRTSLLPQSAAALGIEFAELCDTICRLALARREFREQTPGMVE